MTTWHPSGEPHTPHDAPKYWLNVLHLGSGFSPRPTVNVRNDTPQVQSYQPPQTTAQVVTNGLADGPSG